MEDECWVGLRLHQVAEKISNRGCGASGVQDHDVGFFAIFTSPSLPNFVQHESSFTSEPQTFPSDDTIFYGFTFVGSDLNSSKIEQRHCTPRLVCVSTINI